MGIVVGWEVCAMEGVAGGWLDGLWGRGVELGECCLVREVDAMERVDDGWLAGWAVGMGCWGV